MKQAIYEWFATPESDDGDFFLSPNGHPFSVIPPKSETETIVYCTKPHCIHRLVHDLGGEHSFAAIMRSGLPCDGDLEWLCSQVAGRKLVFLGDADPADLLTFAWLGEHLPIQYVGLSDPLLLQCGVELKDDLTIPMTGPEVTALPLVAQCLEGDMQTLLGPWCAGLLLSGGKIELEALFSFARCTPAGLETAILSQS